MPLNSWLLRLRAVAQTEAARTRRHLPAVAEVMGGQIIGQVFMALTGILIVRHLPKEQYAWFTLYSSLGAMMALVADSGLAAGLNAHGGQLLPDQTALARFHTAAKAFRFRLSLLSGAAVGALGVYLLWKNHCPPGLMVGILAMTWVGMFLATTGQMNVVLHNLLGHRRLVQAGSILTHAVRLGLVALCHLAGLLTGTTACLTAFFSQLVGTWFTSRQLPIVYPPAEPLEKDREDLTHYVRQTMPNALFACVQAQIGALLLGAFGHTGDVANFGALSRVAVLFSVFSAPIFFLASPAFAKAPTRGHLIRIASLVLAGYTALSGLALVAVNVFPQVFFWLIGSQYAGLERELVWVVGAQALCSMDSILWTLALARGWLFRAWVTIPLTLAFQAAVLVVVNPQTIEGVASLSIAQTMARAFVACCLIFRGIRKLMLASR
jgi:O-antigen/teichoic acid export membrane protein